MNERENAIKIAVVEEQIKGLREQQSAHNKITQERFDGMARRFDGVEEKIDDLTTVMNRGKGAYAASMMIAGAIGAFALTLVKALVTTFR